MTSFALRRCNEVRGEALIGKGKPPLQIVRDALLVPIGGPRKPGLFAADGKLIRQAAYYRGLPTPHFPIEAAESSHLEAPWAPADRRYYFAGHLTGHFGHFMFSILGRLWALPRPLPSDLQIVLLNGVNAPDLFELEFSAAIFRALGLTPDVFARFATPVRFKEIVVASPAVEENYQGHQAFADLCHEIGRSLLDGENTVARSQPLYLTKQLVRLGVHEITNEDVFCRALEREGVEIQSPERLPLARQIAKWIEHPVIGGVAGSMMHTSIFVGKRAYVALSPEPWLNSNQVILDRLNHNAATTLYPREGYRRVDAREGFSHSLALIDPSRTAAAFASVLRRKIRNVRLLQWTRAL